MEAIILAGGKGTRLRPLTYARPKPLLPIANVPMIRRVINAIPAQFDRILIPVNYLANQVLNHFSAFPDPRVELVHEGEPLGSAGAIKALEDRITGPFLVVNADVVSSLDLAAFWRAHEARSALATVSLAQVEDPSHFGVVRLARGARISEFVEKPPRGAAPSNLANAGHYALDRSILDRIPPKRAMSLEAEVFTDLAARGLAIFGHNIDGYWVDSGRPRSYLEAHAALLRSESRHCVVGERVIGFDDAVVHGYALGDDVSLGPEAVVDRSVLLAGVSLGRGTVVEDSIIGAGVQIGDGASISGAVIADGAIIRDGERVQDRAIGLRVQDEPGIREQAVSAARNHRHPVV